MKKKSVWKRTAAAAMTAALAMTLATGCGADKTDGGSTTDTTAGQTTGGENDKETETEAKAASGDETVIRVCWWGNQTRNDATVKALDMYEAEHPGVKFEVEFSDWSGYWDKLATQAAGGNLPDIIQMDYAFIKQYVDKGQLVGLKQYIDSGVIDTKDIPESIMSSGEIDGDIYGICAGVNTKALLVNTDVMEEAGVTMSKQPTYEEFFEVARTIYEKTGKQIEIPSNKEALMGERGVPISSVVAEEVNSVVDDVTAKVNAYVSEVAKVATPIDPPFPAASAEIGKNISDLADAVRYGEISPEEAAHEFYEKSTELLKKGAESN